MSLKSEGYKKLGAVDRFPMNAVSAATIRGSFGIEIDVAVVRTSAGLDVIVDRCPHQGVAFTERGCINEHNQLVCTWHNWNFKLPNGTDNDRPGGTVESLESRIEDNILWVKPDPDMVL
ncbi:MAG: Rieske 2Fe-2S domain-containing protein [Myxococcota bacterium]|nr:Rieske 2Fe-2S domain-containing protein [Myxococcota bacterium]